MHSKEYQEGYDSWMRYSTTSSSNPYPKDTQQHKDWAEGHYIAVLEDGESYNAYYGDE